jgi:murein DD-endopeptidase MepM/ murein hydrolase activator NlpD
MRHDVAGLLALGTARRMLAVAIGIATVAFGGSLYALDSARRAAETDAAWLRQRLTEKRALVRALHSDLAVVAQATERVSQMASIARDQNAAVRRVNQIEEPRDAAYTPARLAMLDDATMYRSEDSARALAQLAFLEEQLAATTDSLSLMVVLSKGVGSEAPVGQPAAIQPARVERAAVRTVVARPAVADTSQPGGWPVAGEVSSRFGWRESPYGTGTQRHTGLDIRADYGTPVRVSASGVVVFAGRDAGGYGSAVIVDHGRNVKTLYGHLSGIYVREGQRIPRGAVLGAVGNTGRATGAHLHYEVRVGNVPVDPMLYVQRARVEQVAMVTRRPRSR